MIGFRLALFAVLGLMLSFGVAAENDAGCPDVEVRYTGVNKRYSDHSLGMFVVENRGARPVHFGLSSRRDKVLYPRAAEVQWKRQGGQAWRAYRYVLEDALPPFYTLAIEPGEVERVAVSSELFGWKGRDVEEIYSINLFTTDFKCTYRSPDFLPSA